MRRHTSKPEAPGSITSSRTQSTSWRPSAAIAPRASSAATTPKPSTARKSVSNPTISGSSSTSRTVGVLTCASVAQRPLARGGFPRIFIAASERDHARLVHSEVQRARRESMSRFTMTLAAAAASAVAAIAAVALPAVGADSKTPRQQAKPDARLRRVRLVPAQPWAGRRAGGPGRAQAMAGGQGNLRSRLREGRHGGLRRQAPDEKRVGVARGPTARSLIACVRGHGLDAPTAPDAFKRWLADRTPRTRARWTPPCAPARWRLAPGPSEGPASRAAAAMTCGPPTGARAERTPDAAKQGAAKPGI